MSRLVLGRSVGNEDDEDVGFDREALVEFCDGKRDDVGVKDWHWEARLFIKPPGLQSVPAVGGPTHIGCPHSNFITLL